jgi:cellulose synthase/poly-beta-1,6-N-acetylglucosamine synthase-like glycosyltransferase
MTLEPKWLFFFVLSLGGLTVFFPLLAVAVSWLGRFKSNSSETLTSRPIKIDILIPAFNEAETIERTLQSIFNSCRLLGKHHPQFTTKIILGLDGPSDGTALIARSVTNKIQDEIKGEIQALGGSSAIVMEIRDRSINQGKWKTLNELVAQSDADWSALVDSGTLWPENFLVSIAEKLETSRCVGIAPGYCQQTGGLLARLVWWQERFLKSIENLAGGPVSLHGATMVFRTRELKRSFHELGAYFKNRAWLNDDVVIAFTLRKTGAIDYLGNSLTVSDCGIKVGVSELGRRKRMLLGNLEWIRELYVPIFFPLIREAPVLTLLSLRRVMRVLWAYHLIFSTLCLLLFLGAGWSVSLGLTCFLVLVAAFSRSLREAGWISLQAPFIVFRKSKLAAWS